MDRAEAAILEGFIKERIFKKYIEVQIEVFCCCFFLCGKGVVVFWVKRFWYVLGNFILQGV